MQSDVFLPESDKLAGPSSAEPRQRSASTEFDDLGPAPLTLEANAIDFTRNKYDEFCRTIVAEGRQGCTVASLLTSQAQLDLSGRLVVLRHDVDRSVKSAVAMARIEASHGLAASYYFRLPASWDEPAIRAISEMGHEVGLHYECVDKAKGDMPQAATIMASELAQMRQIVNVQTVSMHGNPATRYDNRDFWRHYSCEQFDLVGEVYMTVDFEKVLYYSDTGRTWEEGKHNIKDFIPQGKKTVRDKPILKSTDDVIRQMRADDRSLYLLTHPSRWTGGPVSWAKSFASDQIINLAKAGYKLVHRVQGSRSQPTENRRDC